MSFDRYNVVIDKVVSEADKKRILVVEDDPGLRSLLMMICRETGHHVDAVADGVEGLNAYETGNYALIITDNGMPRMKGWKMMEEIKKRGNGVPVVLFTTDADLTLEQAQEHGFAHYEPKPVRVPRIHELIAEYLS